MNHIPLAWKNLTHQRRRFVVALAGIAFAVVLLFMEMGFENALFDSTVAVLEALDADLVIVSQAQYSLTAKQTFSHRRVFQARQCDGVLSVRPLYIENTFATWRVPPGKANPIRVLAFDPDAPVFDLPNVAAALDRLRAPNTALWDVRGKRTKFHVPRAERELKELSGAELSGRAIRLAGTFELGTDFVNDGNLIMSAENFGRYFPQRGAGSDPLSQVDLAVVKLDRKLDRKLDDVKDRLAATLPDDVAVLTKSEYVHRERQFWRTATPIGYMFFVGKTMGFIVGVVICYQIIYSGLADHMRELATLAAMGYRRRFFVGLVLRQSLYLALLGFLPGWAISYALYQSLAWGTGLLMILGIDRAALVLGWTVLMCGASGLLSIRKVLAADPAELF